jgi:hypothetical protein
MRGGAGKVRAEDEAVIVRVEVPLPPLIVMELNAQFTPASELDTLQVKATSPEKPFTGVTVMVLVPLLPAEMARLLEEDVIWKSASPVVKLQMLDQVPYSPLEEDRVCTSQ